MNAVIDELKGKAKNHPHNKLIEDTIIHLLDLQRSVISRKPQSVSWDDIERDFDLLAAEGLWEKSEKVLEGLRSYMEGLDDPVPLDASRTATHHEGDNITVVIPPNSTTSSLFKSIDTLVLPQELVDILNHTYFLHTLATEPTKVLPPGKSLLSVLSHAHSANGRTEGSAPSLQNRVEDMVHKAFWNEVCMSSLSNFRQIFNQ
jgi:hypothetical protein